MSIGSAELLYLMWIAWLPHAGEIIPCRSYLAALDDVRVHGLLRRSNGRIIACEAVQLGCTEHPCSDESIETLGWHV